MNNRFFQRQFIVLLFSIFTSLNVYAETMKPLPVHIGGRVAIEKVDNNKTYRYSWPGVYFETTFAGDDLDIKFNDDKNILNIIVDNKEPIVVTTPGKITYSLRGLGAGKHSVRVEKRTETQSGTGSFEGFYAANNKVIKPTERKRRIEFIGDSFSVGYGNMSSKRECNPDEIFQYTNTQLTFGALTAKHFNADYQINASSGFGIVRNYNGAQAGVNLTSLYPYTLVNDQDIYKSDWSPQIIVIGLGGNDFSTPLNPNEKWKTREELQNDYVSTYEKFIDRLHKQHPKAHFLVFSSGDPASEMTAQLSRVVANIKAKEKSKDKSMITFPTPPAMSLERTSCQWHASAKDHKAVADIMIDYLETHPELWE